MILKRHLKVLRYGFLLMVLYASISYFFISCDGVILMGFCGIGKLLLILESLIYFVAWTIITSVFQLVYWVRRRSILNIWWYVIAVITMILFQIVYNTYFAPVVYKIREKASFNNSECIVKDGHNTHVNGTIRTESDCKGGNLNGPLLTFDNDRLVIKQTYVDGEPSGAEIYYNADGSTSQYVIHDPDKRLIINRYEHQNGIQVYYQIPEDAFRVRIKYSIGENLQQYPCRNVPEMSDGRSFTCKNGTMTGTYEETDPSTGKLRTELRFNDGLLSGPAVIYNSDSGEIEAYAEYQNGLLHGKIYSILGGKKEYEGQYENGLQEGIFTLYDTDEKVISKVRFIKGEIVKVIQYQDPYFE